MRIGVVGDSHGNKHDLLAAVHGMGAVDAILHTGDHFTDGTYIETLCGVKVYGVVGNCDLPALGESEMLLEFDGKKIFLTHGHRYNVKWGVNALFYKGLEVGADMVVFGHTHSPMNAEDDGVILFNPGSVNSPRGTADKTYGIIEIVDGIMSTRLLKLQY